jgi:hypothetical protein
MFALKLIAAVSLVVIYLATAASAQDHDSKPGDKNPFDPPGGLPGKFEPQNEGASSLRRRRFYRRRAPTYKKPPTRSKPETQKIIK